MRNLIMLPVVAMAENNDEQQTAVEVEAERHKAFAQAKPPQGSATITSGESNPFTVPSSKQLDKFHFRHQLDPEQLKVKLPSVLNVGEEFAQADSSDFFHIQMHHENVKTYVESPNLAALAIKLENLVDEAKSPPNLSENPQPPFDFNKKIRKRSREVSPALSNPDSIISGRVSHACPSTITASATLRSATPLTDFSRMKKKTKTNITDFPSSVQSFKSLEASADNTGLPNWYTNARIPQKPSTEQRRVWNSLKHVGECIRKCQDPKMSIHWQQHTFQALYKEIEALRFQDVDGWGLKLAKLLDNEHGLPQIFDPKYNKGIEYPFYISTDARGLFKKWLALIWEGSNIFRGIDNIIKTDKKVGKGPSINKAYKLDWHFFGHGHLVNGDWFASQLCSVRDGAHGAAQGGISGIPGKGATSIVISGPIYATDDRDRGDEIWYTGTKQKPGKVDVTQRTQLLFESIRTKKPVRVLRSARLPKTNKYRPTYGLRYDGLYMVNDKELIDEMTKHYLFHLTRIESQGPIRYHGKEKRPTEKETETFVRDMKSFGRM